MTNNDFKFFMKPSLWVRFESNAQAIAIKSPPCKSPYMTVYEGYKKILYGLGEDENNLETIVGDSEIGFLTRNIRLQVYLVVKLTMRTHFHSLQHRQLQRQT